MLGHDAGCRANREGLDRMLLGHVEGPTLENLRGGAASQPYTMTGGIASFKPKEIT